MTCTYEFRSRHIYVYWILRGLLFLSFFQKFDLFLIQLNLIFAKKEQIKVSIYLCNNALELIRL